MVTGTNRGAYKRLTLDRAMITASVLAAFIGSLGPALAKKEKGPLDDVIEKYNAARAPKRTVHQDRSHCLRRIASHSQRTL